MAKIKIEIKGMRGLQNKLLRETLFLVPVKNLINRTALVHQAEARKKAKPHGVDTGETARGVTIELASQMQPWHAKVETDKPYVDEGRRPGKMPPVDAIRDWLRRHGGDVSAAFVVARSIGRRGTKPLNYMKAGTARAKRELPAFIDAAIREVEAIWKRPNV